MGLPTIGIYTSSGGMLSRSEAQRRHVFLREIEEKSADMATPAATPCHPDFPCFKTILKLCRYLCPGGEGRYETLSSSLVLLVPRWFKTT